APARFYPPGIYNVCLTAMNDCAADTLCKKVRTIDTNDQPKFQKFFSLPQASALAETGHEDILLATNVSGNSGTRSHLLKVSPYGTLIMDKTFDFGEYNEILKILPVNGEYMVAGSVKRNGTSFHDDLFLIKA